jgi:tRNA (guanine-N7-)-methyltransferase
MGRRAIPKIDPAVSLSRHLMAVDGLPNECDARNMFETPNDLEVEIGCGKGQFVLNESRRCLHRNFLGNEIALKYARLAAYRLAKHNVSNAVIAHGDGLQMLHKLCDSCAVAVHVYFPDPWWKARHRRRRVICPAFVDDVYRVLQIGGWFHFWTDVEEYFDDACALFARHPGLGERELVPECSALDDMDYRTHFERRMRLNNHAIFRARFNKRETAE